MNRNKVVSVLHVGELREEDDEEGREEEEVGVRIEDYDIDDDEDDEEEEETALSSKASKKKEVRIYGSPFKPHTFYPKIAIFPIFINKI